MDFRFGLLYWYSLLLSLFGIAVLATGLVLNFLFFNGAYLLIDSDFFSAPFLLMAIGAVVFIVALIGCCGTSWKNHCLLMTFGILMLILFLIGIIGGIFCYIQREQVENVIESKMNETMGSYDFTINYKKTWDIMQHEFECCGIKGPQDWFAVGEDTIPDSCCKGTPFDVTTKTFICTKEAAYQTGCFNFLLDNFKQQSFILGLTAAIVAVLQLIAVVYTCYLAGSLRGEYQTV